VEVDGKEAFETTLYLDDIGIWLTILCRWGDARHEALKDRKRLWHDYSLAACCSKDGGEDVDNAGVQISLDD
tara:strand:- start:96 stop:311 length:216 start_codon:yes stop_codon:yes gene_type:complete